MNNGRPDGTCVCVESDIGKVYFYMLPNGRWEKFIGINIEHTGLVSFIKKEFKSLFEADPTIKDRYETRFQKRVEQEYCILKGITNNGIDGRLKRAENKLTQPIDEEVMARAVKQIKSINFEKELIQYNDEETRLYTTTEELKEFLQYGQLYDDVFIFVLGEREELLEAGVREYNVDVVDGVYFIDPTPIAVVAAMKMQHNDVRDMSLTALQRAVLLAEEG